MKTAVITGTSSGLGEALAKALLDLNWKVYGASRRGNSNLSRNPQYIDIKADLSEMKQIKDFVSQVKEEQIDLLINNAGIVRMEKAAEWTPEIFQQIFTINYIAPIVITNLLLPKLGNRKLINIISDTSHVSWDDYATYGASKAALWNHMNALRDGNPELQIVNIHPDAFDSPIIDNTTEELQSEREELMRIEEINSFIMKVIEDKVKFKSGASIFMYNDWLEEDMLGNLHANQFHYNVDSGILKQITIENAL